MTRNDKGVHETKGGVRHLRWRR